MNIAYYSTTDDRRKLNKTLTSLGVETIVGKDSISITDPEIVVTEFVEGCNYFKIEEFGRYYYVVDQTILTGGRVLIQGHVDVLMSHKDEINNVGAIVARSTYGGNNYLVDPNIKTLNKDNFSLVNFPNAFSQTFNHVLTVCG